jgi:hypothetical protein
MAVAWEEATIAMKRISNLQNFGAEADREAVV